MQQQIAVNAFYDEAKPSLAQGELVSPGTGELADGTLMTFAG